MAPSSIFDVNQYLKYENDKQQPLFDHAFSMRYTVGFVFSNEYDATENHPWGGKGGIILKLQNYINIPDGNRGSMICGIMKEVLLAKADRVKLEPNLEGQIKNERKFIIDIGSQEAQIIADAVELGMITLAAWSLVDNHREIGELPSLCISAVGTCIAKLKPLFVKVKNKKQVSLDMNAPTCKSRFLWRLQFILRTNLITVGDARNILSKKKIIKKK